MSASDTFITWRSVFELSDKACKAVNVLARLTNGEMRSCAIFAHDIMSASDAFITWRSVFELSDKACKAVNVLARLTSGEMDRDVITI